MDKNLIIKSDEQLRILRRLKRDCIINAILFFLLIGWFMQFYTVYLTLRLREENGKWFSFILAVIGLFYLGWIVDIVIAIMASSKLKERLLSYETQEVAPMPY